MRPLSTHFPSAPSRIMATSLILFPPFPLLGIGLNDSALESLIIIIIIVIVIITTNQKNKKSYKY